MAIKRLLVRNSFWNSISVITTGALGFFLVPIVLKTIGKENYGLFVLLGLITLNGYAQILEVGLQSSVTKYTAEYLARNRPDQAASLMNSALVFFSFLARSVAVLVFFLLPS